MFCFLLGIFIIWKALRSEGGLEAAFWVGIGAGLVQL